MWNNTRAGGRRSRRGYTLLELLLALALSSLVIYSILWAIQLHLRSLDVRRTSIEEAQLARAVMRMISDDLRSAIQHREQDFSGVEDVLANALSQSAEELALRAGLLDESGMLDASNPGGDAGAGGGAGGAGGATGGDTSGTGGDDTGSDTELTEDVELSYTTDIADSGMVPPVVGLYGNATQLQIDVSRVQRADELYTQTASAQAVAPTSDIQSTSYFLRGAAFGAASTVGGTAPMTGLQQRTPGGMTGAPFDPFGATAGLVRRSVSRSAALFESTSGGMGGGLGGGFNGSAHEEIIAPECVAIQFEYFDGFEWAAEWDSLIKGGLPFCVAVQFTLRSDQGDEDEDQFAASDSSNLMVYRQIIPIPTAEPITPEEEAENLEELEATP
ncbi:MAG: prepilin-type N-terminal cleavage/methylation domain-containing protein [Planctomycetales bacterium]|nr:prepilin-type N-terminal cleavage/methylation domain-containing protein [Planctomycetales bacterium]